MPELTLNAGGDQMPDGRGVDHDHIAGGCPEKPGGPEYVKAIKAARPMGRLGTERGGGGDLVPRLGQSLVHYRRDFAVNGGFLFKFSRSREV
jgi:hypothetical protein